MSLILALIESVYDFLLVINSNLGPISPVSEILHYFCWEERPHTYSTRILGVFPLGEIADVVAPRSEDRKLIICVITFELNQHIHPLYINDTDRRTT